MAIWQAILLGAIQGLTEFIPVSSSGHLVLAQNFMGLTQTAQFDALVNLGTFLALVVFFRRRILAILSQVFVKKDYLLARNLIISAIPVCLVGLFLSQVFEGPLLQSPVVVVVMLAVVGVVMIILEKLPRMPELKSANNLSLKRAAVIGLAQVVSLVPGTSRSASTMVAGRLMGLSYQQAAEYSFLLSIPVIGAVILRGFVDSKSVAFISDNLAVWIWSNLAAFVFGLIAVKFMISFLSKGNFKVFGYYRLALALVIILFILI